MKTHLALFLEDGEKRMKDQQYSFTAEDLDDLSADLKKCEEIPVILVAPFSKT